MREGNTVTEAKTIKLLLTNGSLSGLLMAELLKWDGILFSSPRSSYSLLSNEQESKYWGVYLLVSEDRVYIGQANDLLRRINEHDKTKKWWEKVVLLTTKDNSLNRSDIDYLENKLINIARLKGTLEMNNVQLGNLPKVSRYRETELKDFLEGALLLMELIGIKVFTKISNPVYKNEVKESLIDNSTTDFKAHSIINKKNAIAMFTKMYHYDFADAKVTFASLQEMKSCYWANPQVSVLKEKWYLILHNQRTMELILMEIQENSFSVEIDDHNRLIVRNDRKDQLDLNISSGDYHDKRSKCDFSKYIKKVIKYNNE